MSPPQFMDNYHADVFSQDGKPYVQNLQKSKDPQLLHPFLTEAEMQAKTINHPSFMYTQQQNIQSW